MIKNSDLSPGLVSVVSPCYNVAPYIGRFLESLIAQTYKELEIILVNDGATDDTPAIIETYIPRLEQQGYCVIVKHQENGGLAAAINTGIKYFTGEFLTWPDPDDWLTPEAIERRVELLREDPEAGLVRCNAQKVAVDQSAPTYFQPPSHRVYRRDDLFNDLLRARTYFAPCCCMVRSEFFLKLNPERSIYVTPKASQNLQMLLPITQVYPVIQTDEPLAFYCVRDDSRSKTNKTPRTKFARQLVMLDVTKNTVSSLSVQDPTLSNIAETRYARVKLLPLAFEGRMREEAISWLAKSRLGAIRKVIASALIEIQCTSLSRLMDRITRGAWTRLSLRIFRKAVTVAV